MSAACLPGGARKDLIGQQKVPGRILIGQQNVPGRILIGRRMLQRELSRVKFLPLWSAIVPGKDSERLRNGAKKDSHWSLCYRKDSD
jgi:hypothetical protein